jgi:hypothetical protein
VWLGGAGGAALFAPYSALGPNIGASQYSPQTNIQYEESKPKGHYPPGISASFRELYYPELVLISLLSRATTSTINIHPIARLLLPAAFPNMLDFHATQAS